MFCMFLCSAYYSMPTFDGPDLYWQLLSVSNTLIRVPFWPWLPTRAEANLLVRDKRRSSSDLRHSVRAFSHICYAFLHCWFMRWWSLSANCANFQNTHSLEFSDPGQNVPFWSIGEKKMNSQLFILLNFCLFVSSASVRKFSILN
jgi:hypothetical protein